MNFRLQLKEAVKARIESDVPSLLDRVHSGRFDPVSPQEMPCVTINSFDDPAEKADMNTYKLMPSLLVTVYCEGQSAEDDADALCAKIEDALLRALAPFQDSTGVICKEFNLVGTKIRKHDKTDRNIVFASMMYEAVGYREIEDV